MHKKPFKPPYILPLSRKLRKNMTPAERKLWTALRERKVSGCRFRRQAAFGRYILDFYCPRKKLAIEIDGSAHMSTKDYDKNRDAYIEAHGVKVLRFTNEDILDSLERVVQIIKTTLFKQK